MLPRGLEPRTLGLLDLRSDQLSYESDATKFSTIIKRAAKHDRATLLPRGLEPRTLGLLDLRSDQLSYESVA